MDGTHCDTIREELIATLRTEKGGWCRIGGIVNALYCRGAIPRAEGYSRKTGVRESFINPHPDLEGHHLTEDFKHHNAKN